MKRTLLIICCLFAIGLVTISFTSCNSCGDTERFVDDIGYGSWDFDGDGNAGREINFKGRCIHVDNHLPWNECDKCGLHKVYW